MITMAYLEYKISCSSSGITDVVMILEKVEFSFLIENENVRIKKIICNNEIYDDFRDFMRTLHNNPNKKIIIKEFNFMKSYNYIKEFCKAVHAKTFIDKVSKVFVEFFSFQINSDTFKKFLKEMREIYADPNKANLFGYKSTHVKFVNMLTLIERVFLENNIYQEKEFTRLIKDIYCNIIEYCYFCIPSQFLRNPSVRYKLDEYIRKYYGYLEDDDFSGEIFKNIIFGFETILNEIEITNIRALAYDKQILSLINDFLNPKKKQQFDSNIINRLKEIRRIDMDNGIA